MATAYTGPDPRDMSDVYNTPLTPPEEEQYQVWAKQTGRERDVYDYDLRGAWKDGASQSENGHLPDTYKKPSHPTFSNESKYNGFEGMSGGKWQEHNGKPVFIPGPANLHWRNPDQLKEYFKQVEPDVELQFPRAKNVEKK